MIRTYYSPITQITTKLSGGRLHYAIRPKYLVKESQEYFAKFGENLWQLSDKYLEGEKNWDILLDNNEVMFPYDVIAGQKIKLPSLVIENEPSNVVVL